MDEKQTGSQVGDQANSEASQPTDITPHLLTIWPKIAYMLYVGIDGQSADAIVAIGKHLGKIAPENNSQSEHARREAVSTYRQDVLQRLVDMQLAAKIGPKLMQEIVFVMHETE